MGREGMGLPRFGRARGARRVALLGAVIGLLELTGCADTPTPRSRPDIGAATPAPSASTPRDPASSPAPEAPQEAPAESWIATRVVDGDTLDVTDGAASETVRILGIDTPERGECGFAAAAQYLGGLLGPVDEVMLSGAGSGKDDRDSYGRILRYVDAGGLDVGLALIMQGFAIARYDSRDGYGAHPRQGAYVTADEATPAAKCPAQGQPSQPPPPNMTNTPANPGNTKNCGDFASWRAAQDWFDHYYPHYGDVARLDQNNDLIACQSLAGAP